MAFFKGFEKTAASVGALKKSKTMEHVGLGLLYPAAALHTYKGFKDKDKGETMTGAAELGGLAALSKAVSMGHK